MKSLFKNSVFVILLFGTAIYLPSCKKEATLPIVTTVYISGISYTIASIEGKVIDDGGAEVIDRGICWNTSENPTITNRKNDEGTGLGFFFSDLKQLIPYTTYYARAYATNRAGTGYSDQVSFITNQIEIATLTTNAVTEITEASAISGGHIINDVGGTLTAWGVCWGTSAGPTTNNSKTTETEYEGSKDYFSYINGLQHATKYYVRAYATNAAGTAYGDEMSFTTSTISLVSINPD